MNLSLLTFLHLYLIQILPYILECKFLSRSSMPCIALALAANAN